MREELRPKITVLLITYNHSAFVTRALESIVLQRVDADIELLVADDVSTDDTLEMVNAFALAHQWLPVRRVPAEANVGVTRNYERAFHACDGDFVAVLEGDDYWISPDKLQAQLDFLRAHQECNLCSVNYYVYEEARAQFTPRVPASDGFRIFGARELIADNLVGNFSTCLYRTAALKALPTQLFTLKAYDWAVNICVAMSGLIGFIECPMSVYRIHGQGAWSYLSHVEKLKAQLSVLPDYDTLTKKVFTREFAILGERLATVIRDAESTHEAIPVPTEPFVVPPLQSKWLDAVPPIILLGGRFLLPPMLKRYISRKVFGT